MGEITVILVSVLSSIATLILISLGLAVVFGMMRIINLAHGEFIMLGAYAMLVLTRQGLNLWLAMIGSALCVGLVGLIIERTLMRFLYERLLDTMLATWGLSLILVQAVVVIFGPATHGIGEPLGDITMGGYTVSEYDLFTIAAAIVLLAVVYVVFAYTPYGIQARAATQDPEMAAALGINTGYLNMLTFSFGAALAGAAGALLAPVAGVVPTMGQAYVARAFMTVVVGGQGVILGTTASASIMGGVYSGVSYLLTPFLAQAALLLIAILLIRFLPRGLSALWRTRL
jgi:branched-chain amino acid transport system permease protein